VVVVAVDEVVKAASNRHGCASVSSMSRRFQSVQLDECAKFSTSNEKIIAHQVHTTTT